MSVAGELLSLVAGDVKDRRASTRSTRPPTPRSALRRRSLRPRQPPRALGRPHNVDIDVRACSYCPRAASRDAAAVRPPRAERLFSVIISEKGGAERRESFDRTEINVGRVQGNDLMLPKGNVSKRHARLLYPRRSLHRHRPQEHERHVRQRPQDRAGDDRPRRRQDLHRRLRPPHRGRPQARSVAPPHEGRAASTAAIVPEHRRSAVQSSPPGVGFAGQTHATAILTGEKRRAGRRQPLPARARSRRRRCRLRRARRRRACPGAAQSTKPSGTMLAPPTALSAMPPPGDGRPPPLADASPSASSIPAPPPSPFPPPGLGVRTAIPPAPVAATASRPSPGSRAPSPARSRRTRARSSRCVDRVRGDHRPRSLAGGSPRRRTLATRIDTRARQSARPR